MDRRLDSEINDSARRRQPRNSPHTPPCYIQSIHTFRLKPQHDFGLVELANLNYIIGAGQVVHDALVAGVDTHGLLN